MYSKIINPLTGRKVSITGKLGKTVLRNYLQVLIGGAAAYGRRAPVQIFEVATKHTGGTTYHKVADTLKALTSAIANAEKLLHSKSIIVFKMVFPDNRYKRTTPKAPHQAHTFALARDTTHLVIYDNSGRDKYEGRADYLTNYKYVINKLAGARTLVFFPTDDLVSKVREYTNITEQSEGSCRDFINALRDHRLLQVLPLSDVEFTDLTTGKIWKFDASSNTINQNNRAVSEEESEEETDSDEEDVDGGDVEEETDSVGDRASHPGSVRI